MTKALTRERSGSVVECLTRDRRAAGSSFSTGSTQEDTSRITERLLSGRKESNQTNQIKL